MNSALIDLRALVAIGQAASTETTRYYLNGVCVEIEPRSVTYVATDGAIVLATRRELEDENTLIGTFIIPRAVVQALKLKGCDLARLENISPGMFTLAGQVFEMLEGCFPAWRRFIPGSASGELAQYDALLLARAQEAARIIADIKRTKIRAWTNPECPHVHHNGDSAALLSWNVAPDLLCAVMPFTSKPLRTAPIWFLATPHGQSVSQAAE